jgi:acyl carrier protein
MCVMVKITRDSATTDCALTDTEHLIATLWSEVLQTTQHARPSDNFFDLGGGSIDMITLLYRIHEELSVKLPDNAVFEAPSLRELAALVDAARTNS